MLFEVLFRGSLKLNKAYLRIDFDTSPELHVLLSETSTEIMLQPNTPEQENGGLGLPSNETWTSHDFSKIF